MAQQPTEARADIYQQVTNQIIEAIRGDRSHALGPIVKRLGRHAFACANRGIDADEHSAGGDIPDQAQFAPIAGHQRPDPKKADVPFGIPALGRAGRGGVERIKGRFDRLSFQCEAPNPRRTNHLTRRTRCDGPHSFVRIAAKPYLFLAWARLSKIGLCAGSNGS